MDRPLVLFDGVCNLCNRTVSFLIDHDPQAILRFASLQSDVAKSIPGLAHPDYMRMDSIILVDQGRIHTESSAALLIARRLGWPWKALAVLRVVPRPVRDALYRFIAKNRYRWFGRRETCRLPSEAERARFL